MLHDGWFFIGMHLFGWLFWIAAIIVMFALWTPLPRCSTAMRRANSRLENTRSKRRSFCATKFNRSKSTLGFRCNKWSRTAV